MKAFIYKMLFIALALAKTGENAAEEGDPVTKTTQLNRWMSPALASGYLTLFFLVFVSYNAFLLLGAIQVPSYQLEKSKDEKEAASNPFKEIWG